MHNAKLIDVSRIVEHGMITYKGLPAPIICDYLSREASRASYAEGTTFHVGKIEMVANTATYLDTPFHRYADGKDLADVTLASLAHLDGVVFHAHPSVRAIAPDLYGHHDLTGKAVLIHTGWEKHWRTEHYFEGHPFLTRETAQYLYTSGVTLVGIDSYSIDDTPDGARPVHSIVLRAEIPTVEHKCNLGALPERGVTFCAVPAKVKGCGTFPVRAFAVVTAQYGVPRRRTACDGTPVHWRR
jgi:arylformamidase